MGKKTIEKYYTSGIPPPPVIQYLISDVCLKRGLPLTDSQRRLHSRLTQLDLYRAKLSSCLFCPFLSYCLAIVLYISLAIVLYISLLSFVFFQFLSILINPLRFGNPKMSTNYVRYCC